MSSYLLVPRLRPGDAMSFKPPSCRFAIRAIQNGLARLPGSDPLAFGGKTGMAESREALDVARLLCIQLIVMFSYDHNKSLGYLAGIANRLLSYTLGKRFQEAGIEMTAEQWGAIIILLNDDSMTQGQLGERLHLERSSVSRLVVGLERRGWIVRKKVPGDGRHKLVSPTLKALETAERCAVIARATLKEAQRGMTEDEQMVCRSFLARIIANLEDPAV